MCEFPVRKIKLHLRGFSAPFLVNISGRTYPGVLELAYIGVLEASAVRIKGSTPFAWTKRFLKFFA